MTLPKYKCHKVVEAFKIGTIKITTGLLVQTITLLSDPVGDSVIACTVAQSWMDKHSPVDIGGYFIRYEDGYESYSPATAFEAGYKLVTDGQ